MTFEESTKAAEQVGLYHNRFVWDVEVGRGMMDRLSACMDKYPGSRLFTKIGFNKEKQEVEEWHGVVSKEGKVLYAENTSHPCPPFPDCG